MRRAARRLLVVYVAGRDEVSRSRVLGVRKLWGGMQREYPGWSLRCLLTYGGLSASSPDYARGFAYMSDPTCPELTLTAPDSYLELGHKVKAMLTWVAQRVTTFDFLLKTDVDTLICFTMVTDMIDAMRVRFATDQRIYLGHIET